MSIVISMCKKSVKVITTCVRFVTQDPKTAIAGAGVVVCAAGVGGSLYHNMSERSTLTLLQDMLKDNNKAVLKEVGSLREDMRSLRENMGEDMGNLRKDMGEDMGKLREDMGTMRTEVGTKVGGIEALLKKKSWWQR